MVRHNAKKLSFGIICRVAIHSALSATFCLVVVPASRPGNSDRGHKKVTLIFHARDQDNNLVNPSSVDVQVTERGRKLKLVDGPKSAGPLRVALLLDSNYHQRKVLTLERRTAAEMLLEFEKRDAKAVIVRYGTEIYPSGELTNDWARLKGFVDSTPIETDKHNETVLLYDAMKRAIESLGNEPATNAVVIFSEGNDRGSSIGWEKLARLAQRSHTACYVALFADHSFYGREVRHYGYRLVELAPRTGGQLWEVGANARQAHEIAQQLVMTLDSQGTIEVLVPNGGRADIFHSIKVASSGYHVIAQLGYFEAEAK
jgi:hypothetical protein